MGPKPPQKLETVTNRHPQVHKDRRGPIRTLVHVKS